MHNSRRQDILNVFKGMESLKALFCSWFTFLIKAQFMLVALQLLPAGSMSKSTKETSLWITAQQPLPDTCVSMEYIHSVLCCIRHGNKSSLHCLEIILRFDLIERIFLFFIAQSI